MTYNAVRKVSRSRSMAMSPLGKGSIWLRILTETFCSCPDPLLGIHMHQASRSRLVRETGHATHKGYGADRRIVERNGSVLRSRISVHEGFPVMWRRALYTVALCGAVLSQPSVMLVHAAGSKAHASTASTSRWWKLACGEASRQREAETTACAFTVKLRGVIDGSRLHLVRQALQRRDTVRRALHRDVDFHVDIDSQGGEIFAALEIGRIMRAEGASIAVGKGASCISACVFLLMGAIERHISGDARVGIHRPSLRAPQEGGPRPASEDEIVSAMSEQLVL